MKMNKFTIHILVFTCFLAQFSYNYFYVLQDLPDLGLNPYVQKVKPEPESIFVMILD